MNAKAKPARKIFSASRQAPHKRMRERAAMRIITSVMDADLGNSTVQDWLIKSICHILDAEAGCLYLNSDGQDELIFYQAGREATRHLYHLEPAQGSGYIETCLQLKAPVSNNQPSPTIDGPWTHLEPNLRVSSFICGPLVIHEQPLGALAVFNQRNGGFTPHDQKLLERIATAIAHALYNARLIQQLKVANADLEVSHWQLLRSRNTLRALFDNIPASIYIIDERYNLAAVNMHRANRNSTPPNHLVGRRCYEALYGRDDVCENCQVIDTIFGGQITTRTRREWLSDHDRLEWEISTYPILDDNGKMVQAILVEQDVTEKRRLEATLAQSEKLAAVGQLAAGLAHEINNPLTAIMANAQLLQRELDPADDKQEMVDLISRAGSRATQVVRNLLDLARKEAYDFAPVDVNDTIRNSLALLQHEFIKRSVDLVFQPGENLPKIKASQDHLQSVWLNLLSNALDALENGRKEIHISSIQQGNEVRVIVTDSGKGISPERLSRIFEPFYTTKAPGRGTGLGLSVCHRIIKQHGGRILVDSQPEIGTQFTVTLPLA